MALKITLKPHERMILGGAVITNGSSKSKLIIENNVPILRQKDILNEKEADSPSRRIYFVIQLMYVDPDNLITHHNTYWKLIQGLVEAVPSPRVLSLIDQISSHILGNRYYQALKLARQLIDYEEETLKNVRQSTANLQKRK
ncbi:MAG: flagellar protein FlbT [Deltaproteobacteria bacterium]|nr:flagellar protein FlbT [Deltaproteobacteria bacterium]